MNIFSRHFERFLESRRNRGLFRRRVILEALTRGKRPDHVSQTLNRRLLDQASRELDELLTQLGTSVQGLSQAQAHVLREKYGPNEVEHERPISWPRHLWLSYNNPFNLLLTVLAAVSYFTGDMQGTVVIGVMVVLATLIRFFQERRSNAAAQALKERVSNTATVRRRGDTEAPALGTRTGRQGDGAVELPIGQLVPGDIVLLSAGDMVPADCRVMSATDLFLGQSAMTGESLPVEKFPSIGDAAGSALEMGNLVFMGTNVISGAATVVVLSTGNATYFGTLATRVTRVARVPTRAPSSSASTRSAGC